MSHSFIHLSHIYCVLKGTVLNLRIQWRAKTDKSPRPYKHVGKGI